MKLLDVQAVRDGWKFPLAHCVPVLAGAGLYAVLFAIQNTLGANAGVEAPLAGPLSLVFGLLAFGAFVVSFAAWGRLALGKTRAGLLGHQLGADEGRLALVAVLFLILIITVVGTAFLALTFMIAALSVINVPQGAPEPAPGDIDILELMGTGETAVAIIAGLAFAFFSSWFTLRLVLAYPATVATGTVQVLSAWPASAKGRALTIGVALVVTALPGLLLLAGLNALSHAAFNMMPIATHSVGAEPAGAGFFLLSLGQGLIAMGAIGAPLAAALCSLHERSEPVPTA